MEEENNKGKNKYKKILIGLGIISFIIIIFGTGVLSPLKYETLSLIFLFGGIILMVYGSLAVGIIMLIKMFREAKKYNKYLEDNNIDESAEEEAFKQYINSTRHNIEATSFRSLSLWLRACKDAPKDKSKSSWFNLFVIILFLICCLGFIVLGGIGLFPYALGCLGLGFSCIFFLLIKHLVHKKISTSRKNIDMDSPSMLATVISSVISDESSFSTGGRRRTQTTRILSTTYLVYLDVAGEQKKAYSKTFYNKGTKVYVRANKKLKDMVVIDER